MRWNRLLLNIYSKILLQKKSKQTSPKKLVVLLYLKLKILDRFISITYWILNVVDI